MTKKKLTENTNKWKRVPAKDKLTIEEGQWAPINLATLALMGLNKLNGTTMRVYLFLSAFYNLEKKFAYPSHKTIAKSLSCSKASVIRAIDDLVELGYLQKENRTNEYGGLTSNAYEPLLIRENYKDVLSIVNNDAKHIHSNSDGVAELQPPDRHICSPHSCNIATPPDCNVATRLEKDVLEDLIEDSKEEVTNNSHSSSDSYPTTFAECKKIVADAIAYRKALDELPKSSNIISDIVYGYEQPEINLPQPDPDIVDFSELFILLSSCAIPEYDIQMENEAEKYFNTLGPNLQLWVRAIYNYVLHINVLVFKYDISKWVINKRDIENCLVMSEHFGTGIPGWKASTQVIDKICENAFGSRNHKYIATSYLTENLKKNLYL